MKKFFILSTFVALGVVSFFASNKKTSVDNLLTSNVEALTEAPDPGVMVRNFIPATVWYPANFTSSMSSVVTVSAEIPSWITRVGYNYSYGCSMTWNSATCCITGTDMSGCDFNYEDSKCSQIITRPAH